MITVTPNTQQMYFKGTNVTISSVIARLEFTAPKDGKSIQVAPSYYEDLAAYEAGNNTISITGVEGFLTDAKTYSLSNGDDPETWKAQTIQVAHDEVKADLEALGYTVVISGL